MICAIKFHRNWHDSDITFHFDSWIKSDNTMSLEIYMIDVAFTDASYMEIAGEILKLKIYCFTLNHTFFKTSLTVFNKLV